MKRKSRVSWFHLVLLALGTILTTGLSAACPLTVLPGNGATSGNARCPMTRYRYERSVYLITASELAASGLVNGASIAGIGWNYYTAPGLAGSAPLIVYLQNTADTTNTKSTTWATAITGMTTVHNATTNLPNVTGPFDIPFSGGSPFTYTGGGIYVAFDWGNYTGTLSTTAVAYCNTALTNGLLGNQSTTSAPTTLGASSFRPETRLAPSINNDAGVDLLISMGSLPLGVVSNSAFQAQVSNYGNSTKTNLAVTLNITGADTFTDTQVIPSLAPCTSTLVSFTGFTPISLGACTVTASVPAGDDNPANDSKSHPLNVTANIHSYKYPGTVASGGVGLAGATGEFLAKFRTDAASQVDSVILEFPATGAGTYKVSIRGDNGTGAPGASLYLDAANRTVSAAGSVTIVLPSPVAVGPGNFYVGLQQTNTTNIGLGYDTETPLRTGAFYLTTPIGGAFSDFAPSNAFKLNIGAYVGSCLAPLTVDVTPDGTTHVCPGINIPFTATATGGTGTLTYQWTENGADIPAATANTYTANKAVPGTFTYNCKVTDQFGGCINVTDPTSSTGFWGPITVINPALTSAPFGVFFTTNFSQNGGVAPVTYTTASTLPAGVTLATNGTLSGTPTQSGSFPITVTATDNNGCTGTSSGYVLSIGCPTITLSPASLPGGVTGVAYNQTITASGGTAPYAFTVSAGSLPTWLNLNGSTGALTGTPTGSGSFSFTITATDTQGCLGNRPYTLDVSCQTVTLAPASLPGGSVGTAYSQTITASESVPALKRVAAAAFTFSVTAGALPTGLKLSTGGGLSGTPTAAGSYTFTITATDANGCNGSILYTVNIALYDTSLLDDNGRSSVCLNGKTGDWQYTVLSGAGKGVYTGKGTVSKTTDRWNYRSAAGSPRLMLVTYFPKMFMANGSFGGSDFTSQISDRNTKDDPLGCTAR